MGERSRPVQHQQAPLALFKPFEGHVDADLLHALRPPSNARGVPQDHGQPVEAHGLLDEVPGGAGRRRDNGAVHPQQGVHQARLADVGTPDDAHSNPFPDQSPPLVAVDQGRYPVHHPRDFPRQRRLLEELDLLFREVDGGFHLHEGIDQLFPQRAHLLRQPAFHLAQRHPRGLVRARPDQVQHRLGLGQVQSPVQERPLRELPRLRVPRPVGQHQAQHLPNHVKASVAMDLDGILARVAPRLAQEREHHFVHHRASTRVPYPPVIQPVGLPTHVLANEDLLSDTLGVRTAQAHQSHPAFPRGRGHCCYGIRTVQNESSSCRTPRLCPYTPFRP